jgi:hypothetical protein
MITNHSTSKTGRRAVIGGLAAFAALALAVAPAEAKRIGHVAPLDPGLGCTACWEFSLHTAASSPSYAIPRGHWKLTSWRVTGHAADDAAARLLVFRPSSTAGRYRMIAMSAIRQVPAGATSSFPSSIRVRRGDRLGVLSVGHLPVTYFSPSFPVKDTTASAQPQCLFLSLGEATGTGTACPLDSAASRRVNVAATIKRRG